MLTYDVLAALWNAPATDVEVARAVEDRVALRRAQDDGYVSRNVVEQYLRLLRTTGYVRTRDVEGAPAYVLTDAGSQLLAQLATGVEREEYTECADTHMGAAACATRKVSLSSSSR